MSISSRARAHLAVLIACAVALVAAKCETENPYVVSMLPNGNWLLSTSLTATLGGLTFENADIVEYDPVADVATLYRGLDEATVFTGTPNSNPDIDGLHATTDGRVLFSIRSDGIGRIGNGPTYGFSDSPRTDVFVYDPATGDGGLFLDGHRLFDGLSRNLDAVAIR